MFRAGVSLNIHSFILNLLTVCCFGCVVNVDLPLIRLLVCLFVCLFIYLCNLFHFTEAFSYKTLIFNDIFNTFLGSEM